MQSCRRGAPALSNSSHLQGCSQCKQLNTAGPDSHRGHSVSSPPFLCSARTDETLWLHLDLEKEKKRKEKKSLKEQIYFFWGFGSKMSGSDIHPQGYSRLHQSKQLQKQILLKTTGRHSILHHCNTLCVLLQGKQSTSISVTQQKEEERCIISALIKKI